MPASAGLDPRSPPLADSQPLTLDRMNAVLGSQYDDLPQIPVDSTNVAKIAYLDYAHRLFVEFKNGGVYAYGDVTQSEWASFLSAGSKGRWVHLILKKGQKPYVRVR